MSNLQYLPVSEEKKQGDLIVSSQGVYAIQMERPYHVLWVDSGKHQLLTKEETEDMRKVRMFVVIK